MKNRKNTFSKEYLKKYIINSIIELEEELESLSKISNMELEEQGEDIKKRIEEIKEKIDELEEELEELRIS